MKLIRLKLDRYLDTHSISRYELAQRTGIKYQTIDGYYKNTVTRYDNSNLGRIISALDCTLDDIMEVVEDNA